MTTGPRVIKSVSLIIPTSVFHPPGGPDWLLGAQPVEVVVNYCEAKDKFMADWCPETSPELEAMARAEENKVADRDFMKAPAIWIINTERQPGKTGPRVVFGKRT